MKYTKYILLAMYFYSISTTIVETLLARWGIKEDVDHMPSLKKICTPWAIEPVQHLLHHITLPHADYHHHEHSQHPIYIFLLWKYLKGKKCVGKLWGKMWLGHSGRAQSASEWPSHYHHNHLVHTLIFHLLFSCFQALTRTVLDNLEHFFLE